MTTYTVQGVELKLEDGTRHPPGSTVSSDQLTDREEEVFLDAGRLDPTDQDDGDASETTVEHDVPPDEEGGDESEDQDSTDEEEGLDWENDYQDARSKAAELDLDSQGTHEELKQRIREAL